MLQIQFTELLKRTGAFCGVCLFVLHTELCKRDDDENENIVDLVSIVVTQRNLRLFGPWSPWVMSALLSTDWFL